jgi:hypothetical protein
LAKATDLREEKNRESDSQKSEWEVDAIRDAVLSGGIFVVVVFHGFFGGG